MPGDTAKQIDFGGPVHCKQKNLPLGRDAVDILSRHFTFLPASLRKEDPDGNPASLESTEVPEVPRNSSTRFSCCCA